jgi:DNA primase
MDLESLKEEVRARADIVDVIGRVVKLQKASGTWKGLCPFHHEKTPSFNVNPQRQTYHCFGCGVGGDVFKFVMEMENLEFMEALERLAQQTGVEFALDGSKGNSGLKKRLLDLHEQTTTYFQSLLKEPQGAAALAYLNKRDLQPETPENFRLGFAPDSFDQLQLQAMTWGYSQEELEASGLFGEREQARPGENLYDRFRNRLMFPILDEQARVIGFSGRVIPPSDAKAKYLNSPETILFKKSRVLYGIDKARKAMTEKRRAVLCEGQLDVIRCHESGILEAVAAQGTAITENHAQILKRYADEVILLLDADSAGIKAALRSAEVLLAEGIVTRVASLPPGEDPDDVVRTSGATVLRKIVNEADPFVVFQVRTLVQAEGEITETSRMRVARKVMDSIGGVKEAMHREEMIKQAAGALGIREDALRQDLVIHQPKPVAPAPWQPAERRPAPPAPTPPPQPSGLPPTERMLFELIWLHPPLIDTVKTYIRPAQLSHPDAQEMLNAVIKVATYTREGLLDSIRDEPAGAKLIRLDQERRFTLSDEFGSPEDTITEIILLLRKEDLGRKRRNINDMLTQATSEDQRSHLETEIFRLQMQEAQLKASCTNKKWEEGRMLLSIIDQQ